MTKSDVIKHFGSVTELAKVMGISPSAVSQWPEKLSPLKQDQIIGACVRTGREIPQNDKKAC